MKKLPVLLLAQILLTALDYLTIVQTKELAFIMWLGSQQHPPFDSSRRAMLSDDSSCWLPGHINIRGYELADLEAISALLLSIT